MTNLFKYLTNRKFIYQTTDSTNIEKLLDNKKISLYAGFDLTGKSLHVGSLIQIMLLRIFQQHGHRPIILLGGATTKIGDPSGKDQTRKVLTPEVIAENKQAIAKVFHKFLDFSAGPTEPLILDNDDWLKDFNYLDFLREIGSKFSVNQMLRYESVKQRLEREQNLSFLEFNYMILQAYDFTQLRKNHNCYLQIGGSDQWGNIVNGVELNRKVNPDLGEVYGLTTPLLTTSDGKKMGKTEQGAVWLDTELFSAYDYYQFFRNITDDKVVAFLNYFTELAEAQIADLAKLEGQEINKAKEILAFEATKICHGEQAAQKAQQTASQVFKESAIGDDLPVLELSQAELESGIAFSALIANTGIVASRGEAKRIILGGGGKLGEQQIKDPLYLVTVKDFAGATQLKVSAGKKRHALLKVA